MKKLVVLAFLVLQGFSAQAGLFDVNKDKLCPQMTFADDKIKCMNYVKHHFLQQEALNLCVKRADNTVQLVQCMGFIADHRYAPLTLKTCNSMNYYDFLSCLRNQYDEKVELPNK